MSNSNSSSSSSSSPSTHLTSATLEHTWTIDHFRTNIDDGNFSEELKSTPFTLGTGYPSFHLCLYPNGDAEENKDDVSLYLYCSKVLTNSLTFNLVCSLIEKNGKQTNSEKLKFTFAEMENGYGYGWPDFIDRSFLLDPANGLLPNDQLKVHCKITFSYKDNAPSLYNAKYQKHSACLKKALYSGQHSDVILSVGSIDIPAHKVILCAQSAVFKSMFEHKDTKEAQESKVNIEDVDVDTFKVLLKYLYSGQIPNEEQLTEKLLVASDKYLVDALKLACEEHLSTTLTINSAAKLFLFADTHSAAILKAHCLQYIVTNADKVRLTDGWKTLAKIRPELVDEVFQLFVSKSK